MVWELGSLIKFSMDFATADLRQAKTLLPYFDSNRSIFTLERLGAKSYFIWDISTFSFLIEGECLHLICELSYNFSFIALKQGVFNKKGHLVSLACLFIS